MSLDLQPQSTAPAAVDAPATTARRRTPRRWSTHAVRIALIVAWLGSWELAARTVIDPFY